MDTDKDLQCKKICIYWPQAKSPVLNSIKLNRYRAKMMFTATKNSISRFLKQVCSYLCRLYLPS